KAIQRYLRNVMSLRLLMSAAAFVILAALVIPIGLGDLLLPGFVLMVLSSYASLLRNGLYAVQQLGYEAIAVVLESALLLGLDVFRGLEEAGLYGAAYKPIESLLFVPITFLSIVFPVLAVYHRDRPSELLDAVNRFYKGLLLMGWPVSIGIFVLAKPLTPLLLGHQYLRSEPALRVLALALGIAFVNNASIGALTASDRQASFSWAAGWSVVVHVVLHLATLPLFGYQAA